MTPHPVQRRKKLIEVAIPLEAINAASAREKSIRHGHPSTLHLWWARRPLAAARAVIFCQMVDDPSAVPEEFPTEEAQENERLRLFALISELVQWENTTNEEVLNGAREEIRRSWRRCCADNADHPESAELFNPEKLPGFHDPFAGGGALPLEAQRLGLEAYASDLNPVAVLINKAMIEIPPKFAGMPPVNPEARSKKQLIERQWKGAEGLADDVRFYGKWMRDEAEKRIGHLYPKVKITPEMVNDPENPRPDLKPYEGQELTVIAWLWARTVKSPNPAFAHIDVPLASSFMLSAKAGKEAYIEPSITSTGYRLKVIQSAPKDLKAADKGTSAGRWNAFSCLMSGAAIDYDYIRREGCAGRMGAKLIAMVAEGAKGRVYLSALDEVERECLSAKPTWRPSLEINYHPRDIKTQIYGLTRYGDLFTNRQLVALETLSGLVEETHSRIIDNVNEVEPEGLPTSFSGDSNAAASYADAICTYLSFCVDKASLTNTTQATWQKDPDRLSQAFARQALPMTWDFAEANPISEAGGGFGITSNAVAKVLERMPTSPPKGSARQEDASISLQSMGRIVSTDPPYYDNIGYADLSDYFYVWMRRSMKKIYKELFATLAVPKAEELVATPYRHGSKEEAESFFLAGMGRAMTQIASHSHAGYPVTIYYAFKQSESRGSAGVASTGWETFLEAVVSSGFSILGTWPMRTELIGNLKKKFNALASSVVLVCSRRDNSAVTLSRSEFRRKLRDNLPEAIHAFERSNIAPVDVAQSVIGPSMAIFSAARAVLNPDDSPMSVREALIEINAALDEYLSQDEGELDADSRFALTFFESFGYAERDFGDAEGLAKARNVSVEGVAKAGILRSVAGKAQLLRREQLNDNWDPIRDYRLCVWEATQQLIKRLEAGGEAAAGALLAQLKQVSGHGDLAANCRALAYRLYNHCEKTKQAEEARSYNGLVIAWPELERQASAASTAQSAPLQTSLI